MTDYRFYTDRDFVDDASFRRWVYQAKAEDKRFWEQWLAEHPDKQPEVEAARALLLTIRGEQLPLTEADVRSKVGEVLAQLEEKPVVSLRLGWSTGWKVAAAVLLLLGLGWYWQVRRAVQAPAHTYAALVRQAPEPLQEVVNSSAGTQLVNLPDGSSVLLMSQSRISFPSRFAATRREVYLSGEAFFEVAKNPAQPFFVYANELVTKVLGTSFSVRAYETDAEVKVVVKSGRVSVFAREDRNAPTLRTSRELTGLVLTPNQQAVLLRDDIRIVRSVVDQPDLLHAPIERQDFAFQRTPIAEVFATLEKAYGIDIVFDEESMRRCSFTASLGDEPLFEKLRLICETTESSYELVDGQILIDSKGCQ